MDLYPRTLDIPNGPTSVVKCYTLMDNFPMEFLYPGTITMCLWMDYEQVVLNPHFLNGLNTLECAICKPHRHWIINRPHIMDISYPQHRCWNTSHLKRKACSPWNFLRKLPHSCEDYAVTNPKHSMYLLSALRKRDCRMNLPGSKKANSSTVLYSFIDPRL